MDDDREKGDGPRPDKDLAMYIKSWISYSLEKKGVCTSFHSLFNTGI